jgi:hypothetical protein
MIGSWMTRHPEELETGRRSGSEPAVELLDSRSSSIPGARHVKNRVRRARRRTSLSARREIRFAVVPYLLGHVLAHEITHILQGVESHSASGVMKNKWDYRDYVEMQRRPLASQTTTFLIRRGPVYRASRRASSTVRGSEVR